MIATVLLGMAASALSLTGFVVMLFVRLMQVMQAMQAESRRTCGKE